MAERWKGGALSLRADALRQGDYAEGREPSEPNRREVLTAGVNATSLVLASGLAVSIATRQKEHPPTPKEHSHLRLVSPEEEVLPTEKEPTAPHSWRDRPLVVPKAFVGHRAPDLEWLYYQPAPEFNERDRKVEYLTWHGLEARLVQVPIAEQKKLPEMLPPVAFHINLKMMYAEKKALIHGAPDEAEQHALLDKLSREYAELFEKNETRPMSATGFKSLIESESYAMLEALQPAYPKIVQNYLAKHVEHAKIAHTPEQAAAYEKTLASALEYLARHITPSMMLAYTNTELFPVPARAMDALNFLLENAGVAYLARLTALGDKFESIGMLQLTKMVDGPEGSVTNLLKVMGRQDLVPAELKDFSSIEDHIRAGFLFAFHNVITLVQDLVREGHHDELKILLESVSSGSHEGNSTVFLEYLSAAHHRPTVARGIMKDWLMQNKQRPKLIRSTTLSSSLGNTNADREVGTYMEKARQNFLHQLRWFETQKV